MRKLKLLLIAAIALMGVNAASAYTVDDLTSAGWTQVTASSITNVNDNYYMLVDCNSSAYVMANHVNSFRPCYKTIANPVENPSFVWILEGSDNEFNLKSYSTGAYFKQASGWNTSMGYARDGRTKVTGVFELSDGKYTLKCKESGSFIGHWNDNGAAVANDGENIAANKAAKDAPGFFLYSISRVTFDAALAESRSTSVSSATKESPADVTSYIQNADWSKDWGGWESTFSSSGNMQWGQQTLESWNATNVIVKQELRGVPNGTYRLTADVISGPGATKAAYIYGIGTSKVSSSVVSAEASAGNYNTMSSEVAGKTLTADNIVVGNNTITIGLDQSTGWIVADNFKLYYLGVDLTAFIEAYNTALTTAQNYEGNLFDEDWATLNAVITANTLNTASATQDQLTTATANLNAANAVAAVAAAKYTTYTTANTLINGGENVDLTSLIVNPSFENGLTGWTNTGGMVTQGNTSFGKTGSNYCEYWQPNGTKGVSQTIAVLPAGLYSMTVRVKARGVTSAKVFAAGIDQAVTIADAENEYTVNFALDDKTEALIGFEGVGTGAGSSWLALDNFRLNYVGALPASLTAATGKMNATVSAAQTSAVDAYNSNQTVANYNAAQAAIAAAEASIAAYAKAATAIADANALKEAHNFAKPAAFTTFAEAIAAIQDAYNDGSLEDTNATAAATTLGVAATGWRGGANGAAVKYLNDGFSLHDFDAALYINTWSTEGSSDGTNFVVPFYEYFIDAANSLPEKTWSATLNGLENGLYSVSVWVREQPKNDVGAADVTGITIDVNGGEAVDVTEGDVVGNFQHKVYTAEGLVKQGTLTFNINTAAENNVHWLSFKNVKYTKVRDLTPEEAFVAATDEDYAALNEAIEAYPIGFEANEYAPYNNVAALTALNAAKAIDQDANNSQEDVQAATAAITGATWTVNATEVNAVYDGSFEADYSGQTGNINPTGWQRVKNAAADGYNVRLMNGSNAGLAATTSGKALFTKQSAYYGYADGYTMPLKANTYYKITFVYGGWGDCKKDGYVSMAAPDASAVTLSTTDLPVDATNADSNKDSWKSYSATFKTGEAGNYVLGLRKKNYDTSGQSQYVYGDIVLVRATAADFKSQLKDEIDIANAINTTANVGEAVFQIPASAATTLKAAIATAQGVYDDAVATVDGVLQAIEDLKGAEDAYNNAELNAPADGKLFAIVLKYDGWTYDNKAMTFIANDRNDQGNYNIKYQSEVNTNLAQAFTFTKVDGNNYRMSQVDAEGNVRYMTDGKTGYDSGDGAGIRTTTDAEKAAAFKIEVTSTDGIYRIYNNVKKGYIGSQDAGVYTVGSHNEFQFVETTKPSITINTTDAGWGTVMLPFAQTLPEGVKAYTCAEVNGNNLTIEEVDALEANKPYLIEGAWDKTVTGDAQGTALTYTEGLFTGVYAATTATVGTYVLQKKNDKLGFYKVGEGENNQPTVGANHAYLTVSAAGARDAFFFGEGETTAISMLKALSEGTVEIYNLNGVKQSKLQKGTNILKMSDGSIRKVMVK